MGDDISLLDFWLSPFGMRVRIALAEKSLEYEFIEENMVAPERSPLLLKLNPIYKKIPVMIHKGKPVCESLNIVEYIDDVWKDRGSSLLPKDPLQRATNRFLADYIEKKVYPSMNGLCRTTGDMEGARKEFIETFRVIQVALENNPYIGGQSFSFADVALIPFSCFFFSCETLGGFSFEQELPQIVAWAKRCKERASVSKVLPDPEKVFDVVMSQARKLQGIEQ